MAGSRKRREPCRETLLGQPRTSVAQAGRWRGQPRERSQGSGSQQRCSPGASRKADTTCGSGQPANERAALSVCGQAPIRPPFVRLRKPVRLSMQTASKRSDPGDKLNPGQPCPGWRHTTACIPGVGCSGGLSESTPYGAHGVGEGGERQPRGQGA